MCGGGARVLRQVGLEGSDRAKQFFPRLPNYPFFGLFFDFLGLDPVLTLPERDATGVVTFLFLSRAALRAVAASLFSVACCAIVSAAGLGLSFFAATAGGSRRFSASRAEITGLTASQSIVSLCPRRHADAQ